MDKAIADLRHEHEAVLFSLGLLGRMADRAEAGKGPDAADAERLLGFLREFADRCHHGKEEGLLFPAMEKAGVPRAGGPIGQMLAEHEEGRARIRGMAAALEGAVDPRRFSLEARAYISLLESHIRKENEVLFPLAQRVLAPARLDSLAEDFDRHEETVIGAGRHEELHALLEELERRYPG